MVRKKNIITSFSYPIEKVAAVEIAEDYAKSKGWSLSELIINCFEEIQEEKNQEAGVRVDLSAIRQGKLSDSITPEAVNQSLDRYMRRCCETENIEELGAYEAGAYGYHQFIKKRILYIKRK